MIEDSQIVIDWMQDLPVSQVVMELYVNAVECAKPLNASVLLMHLNVYQHERIIYVTI